MFYFYLLSSFLACDDFFNLSVRRAVSTTPTIRLNRTTERLPGLRGSAAVDPPFLHVFRREFS